MNSLPNTTSSGSAMTTPRAMAPACPRRDPAEPSRRAAQSTSTSGTNAPRPERTAAPATASRYRVTPARLTHAVPASSAASANAPAVAPSANSFSVGESRQASVAAKARPTPSSLAASPLVGAPRPRWSRATAPTSAAAHRNRFNAGSPLARSSASARSPRTRPAPSTAPGRLRRSSIGVLMWCVVAVVRGGRGRRLRARGPAHSAKRFAMPRTGTEKNAPGARDDCTPPSPHASRRPHVPDDRFHVVQVTLQRAPPLCRQAVLGARDAPLEGLDAFDVAGLLEAARVHAQVAVRGTEETLEVVEAERVVDRERADDAEAHAFVDHAVQLDGAPALAGGPAWCSHGPGLLG